MEVDAARVAKGMWWDRAWSAAATHMRKDNPTPKKKARYGGLTNAAGQFNGTVRFMEGDLEKPLRTRKPTVWSVWNDLFHRRVSDRQIDQVMARIGLVGKLAGKHDFLVLTKRAERMARYFRGGGPVSTWGDIAKDILREPVRATFPQNLGLGVTVGHPDSLWRIDELLECPAAMRFVSAEPLLEELTLPLLDTMIVDNREPAFGGPGYGLGGKRPQQIDWLILGPETGRHRRPCRPEWIESLIEQADSADVPVFVKAFPVNGGVSKNMAEWPEYARRREFPDWR